MTTIKFGNITADTDIDDSIIVTAAVSGNFTEDTTSLIANPEIGIQTTQNTITHLNGIGGNPDGRPSGAMTFRQQWTDCEPGAEGTYDFSNFTTMLDAALAAGQTCNLRIIGMEPGSPCPAYILANYSGYTATFDDNGGATTDDVPNWQDPDVQNAYKNMISAFADACLLHPAFGSWDLGSIGLYGEWQYSGSHIVTIVGTPTPPGTVGQEIPLPSQAAIQQHIDDITQLIVGKSMVVCLDSGIAFQYGTGSKGAGWRQDGFGNRPEVSNGSYPGFHMKTLFPSRLGTPITNNTLWQTRQVNLETYSTLDTWFTGTGGGSWPYALNFQIALDLHCSCLNVKNKFNPNSALDVSLNNFIKYAGYRIVPTTITHPSSASAGDTIQISMGIKNVGVAPCYLPYVVGFKFDDGGGHSGIVPTSQPPNFLPNLVHPFTFQVQIPSGLPNGTYDVYFGIIDPLDNSTKINLAVTGGTGKWYNQTQVVLS